MSDIDCEDFYAMFKNNHPEGFGRFGISEAARYIPCSLDNAELVLNWALQNKRIVKAKGHRRLYFHT